MNDQWREPDDYLEPLTGVPHSKLRIGQFRLGAECTHDEKMVEFKSDGNAKRPILRGGATEFEVEVSVHRLDGEEGGHEPASV